MRLSSTLYEAAAGRSPEAGGLLSALWALAGAAMLGFTLFLCVLVVAGIGLRLGPRRARTRPKPVFAASSVIVALAAAGLLAPGLARSAAGPARTGGARVPVAERLPPHVYPALSDTALKAAAGGGMSGPGLSTTSRTRSLVLYATNPADESGELTATTLVNLVSHFGSWTAHPVGTYRAGESTSYDAVFYLGGTAGAALPTAFLDDVLRNRTPVMWIGGDIDQLSARQPTAWRGYRFAVGGFDTGPFRTVRYRGAELPINDINPSGLLRITVSDPAGATVLGTAVRADGSTTPWAVHSGNLLFVSENPLPYLGYDNDRYLAFADLLFEVLDPHAATRHRALIRLEDVGPTADPVKLRQVVDYLSGQRVPFSVGVYPVYRDPNGVEGHGDVTVRLSERPALVTALQYAVAHGGSLLMHGYTHQYSNRANPTNGESGQDAEFYLCHLDSAGRLIPDGPVPEDSQAWALRRIDQGLAEFKQAGLPKPTTFEFPHYMASPDAYLAAAQRFDYRYERSLYYPGLLSGQPVPDAQRSWQLFPYAVRDVYGSVVVPENLDYVTSDGSSIPTMIQTARSNLAVRDGVASFFYHPFLGVGQLPSLVDAIRGMGYTFVAAQQMATAR